MLKSLNTPLFENRTVSDTIWPSCIRVDALTNAAAWRVASSDASFSALRLAVVKSPLIIVAEPSASTKEGVECAEKEIVSKKLNVSNEMNAIRFMALFNHVINGGNKISSEYHCITTGVIHLNDH